MAASFHKFYYKMWDGFCFNTGKNFLVEVFSKPIEGPYVPLKKGSMYV